MQHPLEWVPDVYRRTLCFGLLALTVILFIALAAVDQPLRNPVAPQGIVSFELAGASGRARQVVESWQTSQTSHFAAFSLGLDYLFMPSYALALALGTLLVSRNPPESTRLPGALAGYASLAAALFDAIENYALWQTLLARSDFPFPGLAAICAGLKFGLIFLAVLYILVAWLRPRMNMRL